MGEVVQFSGRLVALGRGRAVVKSEGCGEGTSRELLGVCLGQVEARIEGISVKVGGGDDTAGVKQFLLHLVHDLLGRWMRQIPLVAAVGAFSTTRGGVVMEIPLVVNLSED